MPVAGPNVGSGSADAIQSHGNAYFIGVDMDWTVTAPKYKNIILTSIEKRFDISVIQAAQNIADNTFIGGSHIGTLETGEVALSPFYDLDALISPQVKTELEQLKADIIAGRIKTKP